MKSISKKAKLLLLVLLVLFMPAVLFAGGGQEAAETGDTETPAEQDVTQAKYVFVFIGDGMGAPQISAAEAYLGAKQGTIEPVKLSFDKFPAAGITTTHAADRYITGSAASATAIACGMKTNIGVIAMDPSKTKNYKTLAEMAKEAGMKVGILSSVNLDHATPAAFYAHEPSRSNYYNINIALANSDYDYFAGGMVRTSKTPEGEKSAHDVMEERGWQIAKTREELEALEPGTQAYAYNHGFAFNALDYTIDQEEDDITLAEFTAKGIELLDNPNGFFMMVEGGKIDWACHANDIGSSIHDTLAFDEAVREAVDFYEEHPDETLIVVTGDHECGGLTLGFAGTGYDTHFNVVEGQIKSYEYFDQHVFADFAERGGRFEEILPELEKYFGLSDLNEYERKQLKMAFDQSMAGEEAKAGDAATAVLYGSYNPLSVKATHILAQRAGMSWTSFKHTGVPVPTFAMGVGAEAFNGSYDNTDIFHKTVHAMGLENPVAAYAK
jgi:alkaline phosphatase